MLAVLFQSFFGGKIQQCHGTGLRMHTPHPKGHPHPCQYLIGHAIHGIPLSHGFSDSTLDSINAQWKKMAQNFNFELRYFNYWRHGNWRTIASLDLNKSFGIAFSKLQKLDKQLLFTKEELKSLAEKKVGWRADMDQQVKFKCL